MKRRLPILVIILTVIFGAVLIVQFSGAPPPPRQALTLHFMGYTNTGVRSEALFFLSNPPPWHLLAPQEVTKKSALAGQRGSFFGSGLSLYPSPSNHVTLGVWVETTNEPSRIVLRYQESSEGLRGEYENFMEKH